MAKVFLSAGHGGSDPGAIGGGLRESDVNLEIMAACRDELELYGVTVVCSRTRDENDPVGEEVREANASGADVAVSFHNNAGGGHGSECYYWVGDSNGKRLATLIENASKSLGQTSRGIKSGNGLYFIKHTNMTAVLSETAFLDSDDVKDVNTLEKQRAFGKAYAAAIVDYLNEKGFNLTKEEQMQVDVFNKGEIQNDSFLVRITATNLNIRRGPGTNYSRTGLYIKPGAYTIVETSAGPGSDAGWGKLKSGAGWIAMDYAERI